MRVKGRGLWTTQLCIEGHPGNQRDRIYRGDATAEEAVTMEFLPVKDSRLGELAGKFDIVPALTSGSWSTC